MRLTGELPEDDGLTRLMTAALGVVVSVPVWALAAALIFVGVRSLINPAALGNLWECLGAGLAILFAWAVLVYQFLWRSPRRTIRAFDLTDDTFTCTTPREGTRSYPLASLRSVRAIRSRRGPLVGWLIRFAGGGWVELSRHTTRAEQLVAALGAAGREAREDAG